MASFTQDQFINTTPHKITLRSGNDNFFEVPTTSNPEIVALFRGNTVIEDTSTDAVFDIPVTGAPKYSISKDDFLRLVPPSNKIYLVSTISAQAMVSSALPIPMGCRFLVPYSGPDQTKCFRVNGSIAWVGELIDYFKQ